MRTYALILVTGLLVSAGLCPAQTLMTELDSGDRATAETKKKLEMAIDVVELVRTESREAIDWFRERYDLNINVDWVALEQIGVDRTTTVTVKLKNVTVAMALDAVVYQLSSAGGGVDYTVTDGVVTISSAGRLAQMTETRTYPINDLLCQTRRAYTRSTGVPWMATSFLPRKAEAAEKAQPGGLFFDARLEAESGTAEAAEQLMALIKDTISPLSWRPDGDVGSLSLRGNSLVITHTISDHERIAALLELLRRQRAASTVRAGLAVVRVTTPENERKLHQQIAAGEALPAALALGEEKGHWRLDRCALERTALGVPIRATSVTLHRVETPVSTTDGNTYIPMVLNHSAMLGYEVGLMVTERDGRRLGLSLACGSGWVAPEADIADDTPQKNDPVQVRHNVFDFSLEPGQSRLLPVIPQTAKGGAVWVVVWLPEEKQPTRPE